MNSFGGTVSSLRDLFLLYFFSFLLGVGEVGVAGQFVCTKTLFRSAITVRIAEITVLTLPIASLTSSSFIKRKMGQKEFFE